MRFLLDTHAFLWFIEDDPKLAPLAKSLIAEPANEILLSIASVWEIAIKMRLGKLTLPAPLLDFLRGELTTNAIRLLPISLEHATAVADLPLHHRDPFDRLIISQAMVESIPIVSADAAFDGYPIDRRW
jgi:PIN domain nuclease of toxin-antitoxin system